MRNKVNNQMDEQDIFDIPQDDEVAISNIIGNDDGCCYKFR